MKRFITNRQVFMILYCIISGYTVTSLPKHVAESAGTGGWVSLLIATIVFIFIAYVIAYLQNVYEGKTLFEYSQKLIGKFLTYIFAILYIIYFFTYFTMVIRIYCETIKLVILTKTPILFLCILLYIVVCYALLNGLNIIARLCEIYGLVSIITTIIISSILFTQGEVVHIRPLFVTDNIIVYLKAAAKMLLPLSGIEIILIIPMSRQINKNICRHAMLIMGFMGILFIYIVEAAFSVGGVNLLINSDAALLGLIKGINLTYLELFRRLDSIYILVWTMNSVCASSMWGYGAITLTNKIFKNTKYKVIVFIVTTISFLVSQLPKTMKQVQAILTYNSYLGFAVIFGIPCILLLITKVKKYDKSLP